MSTVSTWDGAFCNLTLAADDSSPRSYSLHIPHLPSEDMASPVGDPENQVHSPACHISA
ncbi:hypothetical protein P692DRAFT_20824653, partial [Suillus brevipes Sb2]